MVDFYKLNHIKHVIDTDFDSRTGDEVESKAKWEHRWSGAAARILELPVAAWDCPTTASGEINKENGNMSWNNGNGQGNGQGFTPQGGYGQPQDVYGRLDNAREVGGARFPYIAAGTHKLALVSLEEFNPTAPKVRALFKTMDSRTQQVGGFCVKIWSLVKPPKFANGTTEADEFADFMMKLKGAPRGYQISSSIRTLLKDRVAEQLARGTMIECTGVAGKPNPNNPGKDPYVRVYWNTIAQDPAAVIAMRQRLEQEGIPSTSENAQPQGFQNQVQAVPYPAQPQQPQGGFVQQYQPAQPAAQHAPQPAPAQQPQGVPQGGFLANVPTNSGGNPQGGNQGGGW